MNVRQAFILLAISALLSSGCTRRPLETEGTYDPYNAISLALSLRSPGDVPEEPATKMTATITQDGTPFRGIEEVFVIPFQTESAVPVDGSSARLGDRNVVIHDPAIGKSGLVANNNSHLYELAILPMRMNRVLVYGKSVDEGTVSNKQGKHKNGVLNPSGLDDPTVSGDISFSLEPILETSEATSIGQIADNLISALNGLVESLQASNDAEILAFLNVFATENEISACSYQTLYRFEQSILGALSQYSGTNPTAINNVMERLAVLQSARNSVGSNFPATYGIPEGAVGMWWNGHRFVKLLNGVNISLVPTPLYCYPPSLWYYANSTIKTSSDSNVEQQYKPQNSTWGNILSYYTDGTAVTYNTRAAAIVDQMQYGVGLAEFHIMALDLSASAVAGCPLTGVIIGEQRDVDFSFSPKQYVESRFVYDNTISGISLGNTSKYFQVLVLPTSSDESVHFALEFQNTTASAIQCQQGTVMPGCKFYLAGELKPGEGSKPAGTPVESVFSSDYKTTVNVTVLNPNKAYNTVPDLRNPQLEIGVTVDMDWIQVKPGGIKLPF